MIHLTVFYCIMTYNAIVNHYFLKGHMMWFQVVLSLWSVTSCSCRDKIPEVAKTKVSKPKRYSLSKLRFCHAPKTAHSNTPHMSTSRWGNICVMPPKCWRKERRRGFSNAVVLMQPCQRDAVSVWTRKHFIWPSESRYIYDFYDPSDFAMTIWRFWISDCKYVLLLI